MPSPKQHSERREAYCAWLTANQIDPADVLLNADVYLDTAEDGTRVIVYEACARDSEGRKQVDERGDGVALERRTVRLLVDPPGWWEPYRKPTRDQLLEVVDKVRALHKPQPDGSPFPEIQQCSTCSRTEGDGYQYLVYWPCPTIQAIDSEVQP
ncbi:hypothetical protein [Streptomyces sp. NPDC058985]|uniref:hypothetical protein n=1 Tax=Streptomyces sp. NPDC058985 TaxID=3346684 RepID=UPI00368D4E3B